VNASERIKALWDNRNLVALKSTPYILSVVVFFTSIFLIAFPHYVGLTQGVQIIQRLETIETSFQALYDEEVPCSVNEDAHLGCDEVSALPENVGEYRLVYGETFDLTTTEQSTLYFGATRFAAVFISDEPSAYILEGDYRFLIGFDFRLVNENLIGDRIAIQNETTDGFLSAIYYSTTDEKLITIFISQFFQTIIFVGVLTIVTLLLNLDFTRKKMTLKEANSIMIFGMVGPALAAAMVGLVYPAFGSIAFPFLYGFRIMVVYYYLRKNRDKIKILS
jgi:hypothetical protein